MILNVQTTYIGCDQTTMSACMLNNKTYPTAVCLITRVFQVTALKLLGIHGYSDVSKWMVRRIYSKVEGDKAHCDVYAEYDNEMSFDVLAERQVCSADF